MGLIKAAIGALSGTLGDTWKEAIHCGAIDNKTLLKVGTRMHEDSARSSNNKGSENYISNGSAIMVEENTCMLTIDNGRITNVVTEPGAYTLDNSSAPSIFAGNIKDSAKELIRRFTFGGTPAT
ncbi:MAG: virion core protein (lumpy skin disease virus), partial [Ruminiclostridium sp.]|nr:virion core protein (lumpy skin disease virus) [Ruminiclostridium sp.]